MSKYMKSIKHGTWFKKIADHALIFLEMRQICLEWPRLMSYFYMDIRCCLDTRWYICTPRHETIY